MRRGAPLVLPALPVAEAEVGRDVAGEEHILLRDIANQAAQLAERVLAHVHAVDVDVADGGVVEARDELEHARLAAAGAADYGRHLARVRLEAYVAQDGLVRAGIGEGDVVEPHARALGALGGAVRPVFDGGLGVQHLGDALRAGVAHGEEHDDEREHHYRREYHRDVLAVRHERADLHLAGGYVVRAEAHDRRRRHAEDHLYHRHEQRRDAPGAHGHVRELRVRLVEALRLPLLAVEGADNAHALERLEEYAVEAIYLPAERDGIARDEDNYHARADYQHRYRDVQHHAELAARRRREREPRDGHQRRGHAQAQQQREEELDVRHVRGGARNEASRAEGVHLRGREALHPRENLPAQVGGELRRYLRREHRGQYVEKAGQQRERRHYCGDNRYCVAALARHAYVYHARERRGQQHRRHGREQHKYEQPGDAPAAEPDAGKNCTHNAPSTLDNSLSGC